MQIKLLFSSELLFSSGEDGNDIDVDTLRMSTILDQCKSHTTSEINKALEDNLVNNSSIYFLNIDGNKSNFNNLSVEIARFLQQFAFIGLAETNVGSDAGSV